MDEFRVGEPEKTIVIFAVAVDPEPLLVVALLPLALPLSEAEAEIDVILPIGVKSAELGTFVLTLVRVLRLSGAGALTVAFEGFWQSRLSSVETQQFQVSEAML